MTLPPSVARLEYGTRRFWLPLFLLWPILFLLFVLIFFAGAIALAVMPKSTLQGLGRFLSGLYVMICASRGAQLDVHASERRISLSLY